MKRFWDTARVAQDDDDAWSIQLDARPMRLPGGAPLRLRHRALADAIAGEWQGAGGEKGGEFSYADLPLTRLAGTAQERIAPDPEPVALELARYGETDLLCYRAAQPRELAQRQALYWQPWLDWAERRYGARLIVTEGVVHVPQPPASLAALARAVAAYNATALAGLGVLVPALGSLVLGLAVAAGELDPADAHALALLDETFQAEQWGVDEQAEERRALVGADIAAAGRILALARDAAA